MSTSITMHGPAFDASAASNSDDPRNGGRLQTWTHAGAARPVTLGDRSAAASASPMLFVVTGPQTHRGAPDPVVGAAVVSAALWVMFGAAVLNTMIF